jgi:tripartite-type tricarboxylate transporter receptor subunit TctC
MPKKTWFEFLSMAVVAAGLAGAAHAQYPTKPVKLVVPFIPGSAPDVIARAIGDGLSKSLGQSVIIENRGGAGGNIGAEYGAKQPADGYTLMLATSSHATNPFLYKQVNYDLLRDFAPVTIVAKMPSLLVVPPALPANNVQELIALAKKDPGRLTYASGGNGSQAHLAGATFRTNAGIDIVHVPYKGAPEIVASLLSGQTSMGFPTFSTAVPHAKAGKLRPLAVTGSSRNPQLPDVPTMLESMTPGFDIVAWFGIVAPAGTPPDLVARLNADLVKLLGDPAFKARMSADGTEVVSSTPAEFRAYIQSEMVKWEKIVRDAGARVE